MTALAQPIDPDRFAATPAAVKVLIADDHPLIIAGIRRTIEHLNDMVVVGEARAGQELIELVERRRPDVVIMDLRMPGVTGMETIALIRRRWPQTRIIVLSACDDRPTVDAAQAAGATAYVLKSARTADLASVVRQAVREPMAGVAADRAPAGAVTESLAGPPAGTSSAAELTARERSILTAVAAGMTTAAISRELWISQHTIKFHLTNIYRKLGVANRAGAVRWALEHGVS